MPQLNALHEELEELGFVIVGVSDEDEELLEGYIDDKKPAFPIIRSEDGGQKYGVRGYPTFVLIAPDGTIAIDVGHGVPSRAKIDELLAQMTPQLPDDSRYSALRRKWSKRDYKGVASYLESMLSRDQLDGGIRDVLEGQRTALEQRAALAEKRVGKLAEGPNFLLSKEKLETLRDQWRGLAVADVADEALDRFKHDDAIQTEIKAGRKLERLLKRYDRDKQGERRKLIKALNDFRRSNRGTNAADRARAAVMDLVS